jgi:heme-degrading monooxygenase HmoA
LIVRVLRGQVNPARLAAFRSQAHLAIGDARDHDGFVYAQVGRQANGDGSEVVLFVSVWRDLEALYCWVGGTDLLDTPVLRRGAPNLFETFEVQHYEVWEEEDQVERAGMLAATMAPIAAT